MTEDLIPLPGQTTAFPIDDMGQTDGTDQLVLDLFDNTPEEIKP